MQIQKWKYYKRVFNTGRGDPDNGKVFALFRVDGLNVERFEEGPDTWIVPDYAGRVLADISGFGGGWDNFSEVSEAELPEVKRQVLAFRSR